KAKLISVTGTNGKTTITSLIHHILNKNQYSSFLLGNGGVPFCSKSDILTENDIVVLESSSFQLQNTKSFSPKISLCANFSPNHLNVHKNIKDYYRAKRNNFIRQTKNDFSIFCFDDEQTRKMASLSHAKVLFYSIKQEVEGCYLCNEEIVVNYGGIEFRHKIDTTKYFGHNLQNILGAVLVCFLCGVTIDKSIGRINSFKWLPHRMQFVQKIKNVQFVDDSKATTVTATISAVNEIKGNLALILGGSSKKENFNDLFKNIRQIDCVAVCGDTAQQIIECAQNQGYKNCHLCVDMKEAVYMCYNAVCNTTATVLLSPACASFDRYISFEARGEDFCRIIGELAHNGIV
ncbi:MAG: UDP-N-acetylmuramoyl-L-alanine--D-glutamate ligase, partial [Clostridia bacterium]